MNHILHRYYQIGRLNVTPKMFLNSFPLLICSLADLVRSRTCLFFINANRHSCCLIVQTNFEPTHLEIFNGVYLIYNRRFYFSFLNYLLSQAYRVGELLRDISMAFSLLSLFHNIIPDLQSIFFFYFNMAEMMAQQCPDIE